MNNVFLSGNCVADPNVRTVGGGSMKVGTVSIAVKDAGKKNTTSYFDLEFWNKTAELLGQHYFKGKQIAIAGKLKQESYQNKEGKAVKNIKVVCDEILNLPAKSEDATVAVGNEVSEESFPF